MKVVVMEGGAACSEDRPVDTVDEDTASSASAFFSG